MGCKKSMVQITIFNQVQRNLSIHLSAKQQSKLLKANYWIYNETNFLCLYNLWYKKNAPTDWRGHAQYR